MFKKVVSLIIILVTIFSFSGCVPVGAIPELNKLKKEAKEYMTNYLNSEYEDYNIVDIKQYTDAENFGHIISDITKFLVEIDAVEYDFYYNHSNNEVYSNYYSDTISNELLKMVEQHDIPSNIAKKKGYVTMWDDVIGEFEATLSEDKTIEDIFSRMEKDKDTYTLNADFYYTNKKDFTPYNLKMDTVFNDLKELNLNFYNIDEEYLKDRSTLYLIDIINYKMIDDGTNNVEVCYHHLGTQNNNGLIFVYDDEKYNIDIKETNGVPNNFKNVQLALEISITSIPKGPSVYDEYLNQIGTKTIIYRERTDYFSIFLEPSKWQNCKFYFSQYDKTQSFDTIEDDLKLFDFTVKDIEEYKETFIIFES